MLNRLSLMSLLAVLVLLAAACVPAAPAPAPQQAPAEEPAVEEAAAEEEMAEEEMAEEEMAAEEPAMDVVELEFWHAMGGDLGVVVDELVAQYNDSQDAVHVTATYQGSYDDTYNALLASFESGTEPNITQNFDLASQTMIDTGRLIGAAQLMEADGYDPDTFIPAVRDYYSDENGMVAMAFNSSTPIVYYNKDMFDAAGLEAPNPEWNFSEFLETCEALEASGVEFCVAFGTVGWYFEQILANSGGLYFDNNNGRTGRAEQAVFNEGQGVEVFTFLTGLIADGHAPNLGNTWTETDSAFFTGQSAMLFDSTAGATGIQETAEFPVGTNYIPHSDSSDRNGVVIGGAALWLLDSGDETENAAAWDFMKHMASPEAQTTWHKGTGYFPVRVDLQDSAELQEFWQENPNSRTALEQLLSTKTMIDGELNYPVLGGRAGPFPAIRQLTIEAYSSVLDDGVSPQDALNEAAEKANEELANYNEFFQ